MPKQSYQMPISQQAPSLINEDVTKKIVPVALLIDGENVIAPEFITHILVEADKLGKVIVKQVYGNWTAPNMQAWKMVIEHYKLDQLGSHAGPNATDIALAIGAMDLLYQGIKHFCLVTGDSDYVPLVTRLQQNGCTVWIIGRTCVSHALKKVCNKFISIEQLLPQKTTSLLARAPKAQIPKIAMEVSSTRSQRLKSSSGIERSRKDELVSLLLQAYQAAQRGKSTDWVALSTLGQNLRGLDQDYEKTYGKPLQKTILTQCPDLFEMRERKTDKGQVKEVRLRAHF